MKWDDMLPRVLPFVAGCPRDLALQHLVEAAREFASRTLVWNYQATTIPSVAGVDTYTLQFGQGEELVKLLLVEVNGQCYSTPSGVRGRQLARRGVTGICTLTGPHDFQLSPAPGADGVPIITEIAVRPALEGSAKWPDDLDEHVSDIVHGALASLLSMPNATWRDPSAAALKSEKFEERIGFVKRQVYKGLGRDAQTARVEWF